MRSSQSILEEITKHVESHGSFCGLPECDSKLNDLNREFMRAYDAEHGHNAYYLSLNTSDGCGLKKISETEKLYNFCAKVVIPKYDEHLDELAKNYETMRSYEIISMFSYIDTIKDSEYLIWT